MVEGVFVNLRGRGRFTLLLSLAIILSSVSLVYFIRYLAKPNTGLVVNYPEVVLYKGHVLFSPKSPFSPAVSAGLRANKDYILRINDIPVRNSWDVVRIDKNIWNFKPVKVTVLRESKIKDIWITPLFNISRIDWVFTLIMVIVLIFTAFYLTFTMYDDTASNFIVLASLFYLVFTTVKPFYYESVFSNMLIHLGKITAWLLVFFALYFPRRKGSKVLRIGIILSIVGLYVVFFGVRMYYYSVWSATGREIWLSRYRLLGRFGNVSDGIAYIVYLTLLIVSYIKTPYSSEKRRIEWIVAGVLIALPPYFFFDQLPIILGNSPEMRIGMGNFANLFLMFIPLFFIIGLMKQRVFNIKFFATRYIVYFILALITFSFFTVLYEPLKRGFIVNYGLPDDIAGFIVVTLLFILLFVGRSFFITAIEKLFYRNYYRKTFRYAEQLESKNQELISILEELNREGLKNFQAKKMKELRGIITGIAHRINNPVNYISNSLIALEKKFEDMEKTLYTGGDLSNLELVKYREEIKKYLLIAQEGSIKIKNFVRKLISLAGSKINIPASIEARVIIEEAVKEIKQRYQGINIKVNLEENVKIKCYPREITDAIVYCLENSVEALKVPSGYPLDKRFSDVSDIVINGKINRESGEYIIEIVDKGRGIDEINLKKIFDPFFTTKYEHEGLGLYFCKTIVERNMGTIEVSSEKDRGTRVIIRFPLGDFV